MNALTIGLALLVIGCAAVEGGLPTLDTAATKAAQMGGCVKLTCALPLDDCRLRPGRCERN